MRAIALLALAGAAAAAVLLWQTGTMSEIAAWARAEQRELQNALARAMRAAQRGEPAVVWGLIGASALYGVVHAVGPGHGKFLIGGAAAGSRATALRMAGIALAGSLGQGLTAIALVYGGMALVGITARWAVGTAEDVLAPASYVAIGLIGLWLVWRGVRGFSRLRAPAYAPATGSGHGHDHDCGCGHRHGATAEEAARLTGWRDAAALILPIAMRPCTGAVIVLVIAWKMELIGLGAAAAMAMALGTGAVVAGVGLGSVWLRETAFAGAGRSGAPWLAPALQCAAGGLIAVFSMGLLLA